jgi:hypothetical protein
MERTIRVILKDDQEHLFEDAEVDMDIDARILRIYSGTEGKALIASFPFDQLVIYSERYEGFISAHSV